MNTLTGVPLFIASTGAMVWLTLKSKSSTAVIENLVSSPGKALVAGGYTVLESPNIAITIAVSAKFHSCIRTEVNSEASKVGKDYDVVIHVTSIQFDSSYTYGYISRTNHLTTISALSNNFVEKCLNLVLKFTKVSLGENRFLSILKSIKAIGQITIDLKADNDFYSQVSELKERNLPLLSSSLLRLPKFLPCPKDLNGRLIVAKTGMGSSAALTTSLVASLLQYFGVVDFRKSVTARDLKIVHNVAQLAHSLAQGKIGSGFDVSAAVYGTQIYSRFDAEKLSACLDMNCPADLIFSSVMSDELWTQTYKPFSLPPGFNIVMGDVCCGAESTSMAKKVLDWKGRDNGRRLWEEQCRNNINIEKALSAVNDYAKEFPKNYKDFIDWAEVRTAESWDQYKDREIRNLFTILKNAFSESRRAIRQIGLDAEVEIEPPEQTLLADATEAVEGVLCAGVPGAGGRDALYCIIISKSAREGVEKLWSTWGDRNGVDVCPLLLEAAESREGIKVFV